MAEKVARAREIRPLLPDVVEVHAACVEPPAWSYRPGQFLSLRMGDGGNVRRSYSLSSHPSDGPEFSLLVKLLERGVGSDYFRALRPGDELHFTGPMGFFVPDLWHDGDVVFAVTGAGIAPVPAMVREMLGRAEPGKIRLFWGMRRRAELYWLDRLDALKQASSRFDYEIVLSQEETRERITPRVLATASRLDRPVYYLVGNGDMVRDVKTGLEALGVDRKKQIRNEVFYPASGPASTPATPPVARGK